MSTSTTPKNLNKQVKKQSLNSSSRAQDDHSTKKSSQKLTRIDPSPKKDNKDTFKRVRVNMGPKFSKSQSLQPTNELNVSTLQEASPTITDTTNATGIETKKPVRVTKVSDKTFKNDYMRETFKIIEGDTINVFCQICQKPIQGKGLQRHMESDVHQLKIKQEDRQKHAATLVLMATKKTSKQEVDESIEAEENIDQKRSAQNNDENYLRLIAFLLKEKLSFEQIERLGNFLKYIYDKKAFGFLSRANFKAEKVSEIAKVCFRDCLLEDIYNDLRETKFSLTLDASTISTENVCALRVKYIKSYPINDKGKKKSVIQDKLVALVPFKESSTSQDYLKILKKTVLSDEKMKANLIGIAHDNASTLKGCRKGLVALLKNEKPNLFSLNDPCHCLNLAVKKTCAHFPSNINKFISKIHCHFISPQRKQILLSIQRNLKIENPLYPVKYVETRWLSLGLFLERTVKLWEPIKQYMRKFMEKKPKAIRKTKKAEVSKMDLEFDGRDEEGSNKELHNLNYKDYYNLMTDDLFFGEIKFISYLLNKINFFNENLQTHKLNVDQLRYQLKLCYNTIINIILQPSKLTDNNLSELLKIRWDEPENQRKYFMTQTEFLEHLSQNIDAKIFDDVKKLQNPQKQEFYNVCKEILGKLLKYLQNYLPLSDPIIETLDFVRLEGPFGEIKKKISDFNNLFGLYEPGHLVSEFNCIQTLGIKVLRGDDEKSGLELWDYIEEKGFPILADIARFAYTLPTTSANVEQTFSVTKLFKTTQRNRMSEETLEALLLIAEEYFRCQTPNNPEDLFGKLIISRKIQDKYRNKRQADSLKRKTHPTENLQNELASFTSTSVSVERNTEAASNQIDSVTGQEIIEGNNDP